MKLSLRKHSTARGLLVFLFLCGSSYGVCPKLRAADKAAEQRQPVELKTLGRDTYAVRLLFEDSFADLANWVVEGNGRVEVHDGQLVWDCADEKPKYGTIWCRQPFHGPTIVEYDAVAFSGRNNLNFIAYAKHPPDGLLETTEQRTGNYSEYHKFSNNIITYLTPKESSAESDEDHSSQNWRIRFRRNPGFNLLSETYVARKSPTDRTQKLTYIFDVDGSISLLIDGERLHHFRETSSPLRDGHHGFRTWRSAVRYSNFKVYGIETDLRGSNEIPRRSHRIPFVETPPKIDGRLDEPSWQDIPDMQAYVFPWRMPGRRQTTHTKIAWDEQFLYVAYRCEDTNVLAIRTERDSEVYKDDCVELFVASDSRAFQNYYNIEMNARAAFLDNPQPESRQTETPWNPPGVRVAVQVDGTLNDDSDTDVGWTLELAFPFAALVDEAAHIPPKPGDIWRLNLNRLDFTPERVLSMWSPIITEIPAIHRPEFFGEVIFEK